MNKKEALLKRLEDIGKSLENSKKALALLALGSVGIERERLDEYSDLDFFVIVKEGYKYEFIHNLDWLSNIYPFAYVFKNTEDGYKVLYEDDIFCEFAVFEPWELENISFAKGKIIWMEEGFDGTICNPKKEERPEPNTIEFLVGEAITNLYVGLGRYKRGEKLSAARFVQNYAVDRIVELSDKIEKEQPFYKDIFGNERRYEKRFPNISEHMPKFIQGYDKTLLSAKEILMFLDTHFQVNPFMKERILKLCEDNIVS